MTHSLCDITHSLCGSNPRNKSQCREALGWQVYCYVSLDSFGTRLCVTWLVRDTFMCEWSISRLCVYESWQVYCYGVALVSKIDKIIGFFCKRALQKSQYSAKKSYNLIDPTNRSHPICVAWLIRGAFVIQSWFLESFMTYLCVCNVYHMYACIMCMSHDSFVAHSCLILASVLTHRIVRDTLMCE